MISQWIASAPDYQSTVDLYTRLAAARTRYVRAVAALEERERELKREYPRQPAARDALLTPYRQAVADAKVELEDVRTSVQLLETLIQRMLIELWIATVPRAGLTRGEEEDDHDDAGTL